MFVKASEIRGFLELIESSLGEGEDQETFALIAYPEDDKFIKTTARKDGGSWLIGGDYPQSILRNGGKIFIVSKGKLYFLKGNRLVFQDNFNKEDFPI